MAIVTDHLEDAGFNAIRIYRINVYAQSGENTSPNGRHGCNVVTFFIWGYFALNLLFGDCI